MVTLAFTAGARAAVGGVVHGAFVHETWVHGRGDVCCPRGSERAEENDASAQGLRGSLAYAQVGSRLRKWRQYDCLTHSSCMWARLRLVIDSNYRSGSIMLRDFVPGRTNCVVRSSEFKEGVVVGRKCPKKRELIRKTVVYCLCQHSWIFNPHTSVLP